MGWPETTRKSQKCGHPPQVIVIVLRLVQIEHGQDYDLEHESGLNQTMAAGGPPGVATSVLEDSHSVTPAKMSTTVFRLNSACATIVVAMRPVRS